LILILFEVYCFFNFIPQYLISFGFCIQFDPHSCNWYFFYPLLDLFSSFSFIILFHLILYPILVFIFFNYCFFILFFNYFIFYHLFFVQDLIFIVPIFICFDFDFLWLRILLRYFFISFFYEVISVSWLRPPILKISLILLWSIF
jgi:hypothetical protein